MLTAIKWLSTLLRDIKVSPIYETPDARGGERSYLNAVAEGSTTLDAGQLEEMAKLQETKQGRSPEARSAGDVPIDIDLVILGGTTVRPWDASQTFFKTGYSQLH